MNYKFNLDFERLISLINVLKQNNIVYWIDFGTLLGFYRDGEFLDYDNDIDISIFCDDDDTDRFLDKIKKILKNHFYLREEVEKEYPTLIRVQSKGFFDWIDIYIWKRKENKLSCCFLNCDFHRFFVYNLCELNINNFSFNIPFDIEEFLKLRYGINFKTNIKNFSHFFHIGILKKYTVYATGVFDLFHIGHVNYLKKAKELFDTVIVGIHNDKDVQNYKNKSVISYEKRVDVIKSCKYVDQVYENAPIYTTDDVLNFLDADYTIAGIENKEFIDRFYPLNKNKLFLIARTQDVSTSEIIEKIKSNIL